MKRSKKHPNDTHLKSLNSGANGRIIRKEVTPLDGAQVQKYINQTFGCARPLIFENSDEEFKYSVGGTCFTAHYRGRHFIITAAHCLQQWNPEQVRVDLRHGGRQGIPFKFAHLPEYFTDAKPERADLLFMEVDMDILSFSQSRSLRSIDLSQSLPAERIMEAGKSLLAVRGYPLELAHVCYESEVIQRAGFSTCGIYLGLSPDQGCGLLELGQDSRVTDPNGMSGSPVMLITSVPRGLEFYFAGVLVRGGKGSPIERFIFSSEIVRALQEISNYHQSSDKNYETILS